MSTQPEVTEGGGEDPTHPGEVKTVRVKVFPPLHESSQDPDPPAMGKQTDVAVATTLVTVPPWHPVALNEVSTSQLGGIAGTELMEQSC